MQRLILGLGSNRGDRKAMLAQAVARLSQALGSLQASALYETPALLPPGAPPEWDAPYLNMAVLAMCDLPPQAVLAATQRIERELGRQQRGHWGPREIDIDLLAYGNHVLATPELTLPHAELLKRDFALLPLAELAPDWAYPAPGAQHGRTARELASHFAPLHSVGQLEERQRLASDASAACAAPRRVSAERKSKNTTKLIGILNLTPDSFSDGGQYPTVTAMKRAVQAMAEAGAAVIDVGAESTRPGASPLDAEAEWQRLKPFAEQVLPECLGQGLIISADTRHAQTAWRMLECGAQWINDVSGLTDPSMVQAVQASACTLVVMHSLSIPADPALTLPEGEDVIKNLLAFARSRTDALVRAGGIAKERIIFDPGIGFGKTAAQSWEIIERIGELRALGLPLMVGHSRKSFLKSAGDRDAATLQVSARLIEAGVEYLRVHDVAAHAALLREAA